MLPIDFEGTNITLGKPGNMTDEQCSEVKAYRGTDNDGFPFFLTAWKLSKEDLEAVNSGRPIMLKVLGSSVPPVSMYTYDENYIANV
jgi:hypothetical protein